MKRLFTIGVGLLLMAGTSDLQAQGFFKRLGEAVKNGAENVVQSKAVQATEGAINGAIDGAKEGAKKAKNKGNDTEDDDQDVDASAKDETPDVATSNQKSDFVPGSVVIFEDNFAGEKIGEFPSKWDLDDGAVEMANIGGRSVPQWTENGTIRPLMKKNQYNYLTDEFTIEWDIYISKKNDDWGDMTHEIGLMTREEDVNSWNHYAGYVGIWYRPNDGASRVTWHCQKPTDGTVGNSVSDSKTNIKPNAWNHFAISFNKLAFKLYVNGVRVCNVPSMLQPRYIQYGSTDSNGYPYSCISNMRIAKGAVELYGQNATDADAISKAMATTGKFVTNNILFETGKADLKPESMAEIQKVADYMLKNKTVRFEVQGHTDNQGTDKVNDPLSQKRAEAIVAALVKLGVDEWNLRAVGKGSHEPVADNKTEEGRAKNRRVEFIKK